MNKQNLKLQQKIINTNSSEKHYSKRISYIFVTKNRTKLFNKAIGELKKIKDPNDEIILVNGGNEKIIDNSIDKYIQEPDISPSHALNKGILIAKGKYIKNIADDDFIWKKQLNRAIEVLDSNQDIDLLVCGGLRQKGNNKFPFYFPPNSNYGENLKQTAKYGICGEGMIIRHSSISLIGLIPTGLASDGEYIIQAIYNGATVKFSRICLFYRVSKYDDISSTSKHLVKEDLIKIYKKYNISDITKNNTRFKKIIRSILKKYFPKFYVKRQAKFKVISKDIINYNPDLLDPESHLWDGGFS